MYFLIVDESSGWLTISALFLFSIDSSRVWFTSVQMQAHDVLFITICVTSLFVVVVGVGVVVVVVVVIVGVVVEVVKHKSGLVIDFLYAK